MKFLNRRKRFVWISRSKILNVKRRKVQIHFKNSNRDHLKKRKQNSKTFFRFQNFYESFCYHIRWINIVQNLQLNEKFWCLFSIIAFEFVNKNFYDLNWWLIEIYVLIVQLIKILNFKLFANNVHFVNYSLYTIRRFVQK